MTRTLVLQFVLAVSLAGTQQTPAAAQAAPKAPNKSGTTAASNNKPVSAPLPHKDWWDRGYVICTAALVIVGGFGTCFALRTLRAIEHQVKLMENTLVEAAKSADAARKGSEISELAMIAGNRAYVHYNGFRWISHFDRKNNWTFWRLHPRWINSGNTPTRGLRVQVAYELRDSPLPEAFAFPFPADLQRAPTTISPQGMIESMPRDIIGDELVAIRDGRKHFYVWGIAEYQDVFPGTPKRITKFCCFIGNVTGDPREAYDANSNIVEITFTFYHLHNCADEDCLERDS